MSSTEAERVARRLWERIGFLALSQPVVYEREIALMKTAQRAQGRDTDFLDAKRKTLAQIAESEAREAVSMLEHSLLDQRQAGIDEERERWRRDVEPVFEAIEFCATAGTYHAILIVPDRPAGGFADDFSEDHGDDFYERPMPGAEARKKWQQWNETETFLFLRATEKAESGGKS